MQNILEDVFTEPDFSPDTLANLGPLRRLAGVWQSDQGVDINPKAAGPERRVFREHIRMQAIDPQTNGPQLLYGLRYHIHINTPEEAITFHDQVGYWLWEPATGLIMQTIAIPRGQVVLAGGTAKPDDTRISVEARRGDTRFGICSTTFLEEAFRTDYYRIDITFNPDDSWTYVTRTDLAVRGRTPPFDHRDTNTLRRIAPPAPNPLVAPGAAQPVSQKGVSAMRDYDLYINARKPSLGLYVRSGAGLPDLANPREWSFDGTVGQAALPPDLVQRIEANGHAFRDMD